MRRCQVLCGERARGSSKADALHLDVEAPSGSHGRVNLRIDHIEARLADNIPVALTDLLEIATYVYCADQLTSRGSIQMRRMGVDWRRRFRFTIPVRQLDLWRRREISDALRETLSFLSEDEFELDFVQANHSAPLQSYLQFAEAEAQAFIPDEIILFSGGLDYLAGTVETLAAGRRAALVSHQSSTMIASKQNDLVAALRDGTPPSRLFHIPVVINLGSNEAVEFTQRTRSLMFATLGLVVARMFGQNELRFYENGVVSINLPVAEHVIGARASRTTHPRVLADFTRLFSLILGKPFAVRNPYLWKTKTEVIAVLAECRVADLIADSFSCARVREATRLGRQCGVCSQCIDRRFGVLAAGLDQHEPSANYALDLFADPLPAGTYATMAESYVLRARKLAAVPEHKFAEGYGQIFRALPYLAGSADENVRRLWELHRRHGQEISSVMDAELRKNAGLDELLRLPRTCLLALIAHPIVRQIEPLADAVEATGDDRHDATPGPLLLAIDREAKQIVFDDGIVLRGSDFELVKSLAPEFEADIESGKNADQHRFVKAKTLAERLGVEEPGLRQRVSRTRTRISKALLDGLDRRLGAEDVIENRHWSGYRLNPRIVLVQPAQLRQRAPVVSRTSPPNVTTSGRPA